MHPGSAGVDRRNTTDERPEMADSTYVPVTDATACALLGEGVHTGLRKGTDATGAPATWQAVAATDSGWSDAVAFAVGGLKLMGYTICKLEKPEPAGPHD
jgi:hypothetical protein